MELGARHKYDRATFSMIVNMNEFLVYPLP
jgi:hypothetical protein